jgi:hypothetical protein
MAFMKENATNLSMALVIVYSAGRPWPRREFAGTLEAYDGHNLLQHSNNKSMRRLQLL